MNLEQISEDKLHAVCLQRLWAEPATQEGSKTSAEFPGAPLFKWHWCHWVRCGDACSPSMGTCCPCFPLSIYSMATCPHVPLSVTKRCYL